MFFDEENGYLNNEDARDEARQTLGNGASEEEIDDELVRRFEIKIKFDVEDEKQVTSNVKEAKKFIKENEDIKSPSNAQVYSEVKQRMTVKDSYHISADSDKELNSKVTEIRRDEEKFINDSEDKAGARSVVKVQRRNAAETEGIPSKQLVNKSKLQREFLTEYSWREMQDKNVMEKANKKMDKKLKAMDGTLSPEVRIGITEEVRTTSQRMVGIPEEVIQRMSGIPVDNN